jgi:hypothetical protein
MRFRIAGLSNDGGRYVFFMLTLFLLSYVALKHSLQCLQHQLLLVCCSQCCHDALRPYHMKPAIDM